MSRKHVFLALATAPWGELLYAIRVASQLQRGGDVVILVAPPGVGAMVQGTSIRFVPLDREWMSQVKQLVVAERCASLVLVDIAITYTLLEVAKLDEGFVAAMPVPVIGLDVWDLERTNLLMERGTAGWMLSSHSRDVTKRLIPSPMIRPTGWSDPLVAGVFDSLDSNIVERSDRAALRERMGFDENARMILFPTAAWQQPDVDPTDAYVARLTRRIPSLLANHLSRLPSTVHVVHIGVRDIPELAVALGARYRRLPQLGRAAFLDMVSTSDLLLSLNAIATTIGAAAQLGVPVMLGTNAYGGTTADEILASTPFQATARVRGWLEGMAPLHPFRVWPYGLYRFMARTVEDNPCISMTRGFEVLDEEAFVESVTDMLWNGDAIEQARRRLASCITAVRALPSASDVVAHHLRSD